MPISSTKTPIRRHTIIAGNWRDGKRHSQLEKDWFSYSWVSGWDVRHVITRPQGEFHVVTNDRNFSREQAVAIVDAAITGKTTVIWLDDTDEGRK